MIVDERHLNPVIVWRGTGPGDTSQPYRRYERWTDRYTANITCIADMMERFPLQIKCIELDVGSKSRDKLCFARQLPTTMQSLWQGRLVLSLNFPAVRALQSGHGRTKKGSSNGVKQRVRGGGAAATRETRDVARNAESPGLHTFLFQQFHWTEHLIIFRNGKDDNLYICRTSMNWPVGSV